MPPVQRRFAALLIPIGLGVLSFLHNQRSGRILLRNVVGVVAKDSRGRNRGGGAGVRAPAPIPVCVRERRYPNPQQSIWATLNRFGSGRYRFVVPWIEGQKGGAQEECDPGWPVVLSLKEAGLGPKAEMRRGNNSGYNSSVVLTFHRGDEGCWRRNWTEQYRGVHPDFSMYWDGKRNPISAWNSTRYLDGDDDGGSVSFLPLGPQFTFRPVKEGDVVPPSERRYLLNFMGTLSTSRTRWRLARILTKMTSDIEFEKKRRGGSGRMDGASPAEGVEEKAREEEEERISSDGLMTNSTVPDVFLKLEILVVTPKLWKGAVARERKAAQREEEGHKAGEDKKEYLPAEAYRTALLQSIFTLCPSGRNPESYRIFESAEAGSIPVVALDASYRKHSCRDAFLPFIASGAPFVFLQDWSELGDALADLVAEPERLAERQDALRRWYREFMTGVSVAVERVVDARLRGRPVDLPRVTPTSTSTLERALPPPQLDDVQRRTGLPVVFVGMNEAGTSTIRDYFRCGGMNTSHYLCGKNDSLPLCADVIKENVENGRPPLSGKTMEWDVFAKMGNSKACYYPQMESLFQIHKQYPHSTFVLATQHATDQGGPNRVPKKLVECDLPGLPAGVGSKDEELELWLKMHAEHVRGFVSRHPSHRLVEVSISSEEAGQTMEEHFGISADCWGHSNKERKKATRTRKAVRSASTNHT